MPRPASRPLPCPSSPSVNPDGRASGSDRSGYNEREACLRERVGASGTGVSDLVGVVLLYVLIRGVVYAYTPLSKLVDRDS